MVLYLYADDHAGTDNDASTLASTDSHSDESLFRLAPRRYGL